MSKTYFLDIGIHLIDLVCYLFGDYKSYKMFRLNDKLAKGQILFNNAKVNFYLSIDRKDLSKDKNKKVIRDFIINNRKIDLVKSPHVEASYHLQLSPGTNVAVINAIAHVIAREKLLDQKFIDERCDAEEF